MLLEINNPREAIIESYTKPISYKNYILFKGKLIVCFRQEWLYLDKTNIMRKLIYLFLALIIVACNSDDSTSADNNNSSLLVSKIIEESLDQENYSEYNFSYNGNK